MEEWRLADARNRFTELVDKALSSGPQAIQRRNAKVILISEDEYERLTGRNRSFKRAILNPPHSLEEIDLARDKSAMRAVDL